MEWDHGAQDGWEEGKPGPVPLQSRTETVKEFRTTGMRAMCNSLSLLLHLLSLLLSPAMSCLPPRLPLRLPFSLGSMINSLLKSNLVIDPRGAFHKFCFIM